MFQAIFRLCLLRGSPADVKATVPNIASFVLFLVVLAWLGGGGIGTVNRSDLSAEELKALRTVITVIPLLQHAFAALMIFTVLNIRRFIGRFAQTLTSYFGIQVLFQAGVVTTGVVFSLFPSQPALLLVAVVQLAIQIWFFAVLGHICRFAFNIKMYQGVLAAIVIMLLSYFLAGIATGLLLPEGMRFLVDLE